MALRLARESMRTEYSVGRVVLLNGLRNRESGGSCSIGGPVRIRLGCRGERHAARCPAPGAVVEYRRQVTQAGSSTWQSSGLQNRRLQVRVLSRLPRTSGARRPPRSSREPPAVCLMPFLMPDRLVSPQSREKLAHPRLSCPRNAQLNIPASTPAGCSPHPALARPSAPATPIGRSSRRSAGSTSSPVIAASPAGWCAC